MRFDESTHRLRWQFGADEVLLLRREANARSVREAEDALREYGKHAQMQTATDFQPLDCAQEKLMRRFFIGQMGRLCTNLHMPHKVRSTAMTYFHRFYLRQSVMDAEPKHIMMASVYVACKTEEHYISAEELARNTKQDPTIVLREELNLLEVLNFDLIVQNPYRPLSALEFVVEGLGADANTRKTSDDASSAAPVSRDDMSAHIYRKYGTEWERKDLFRVARRALNNSMATDAALIFPPGLMALAAFRHALKKALEDDEHSAGIAFMTMAETLYEQACLLPESQRSESSMSFLRQFMDASTSASCISVLDDVEAYIRDGEKDADFDRVRDIDRQLKACRNPVRNQEAPLYKHVHAKEIQEAEARRKQKAKAKRAAHDANMRSLMTTAANPTTTDDNGPTIKRRKTATPPPPLSTMR